MGQQYETQVYRRVQQLHEAIAFCLDSGFSFQETKEMMERELFSECLRRYRNNHCKMAEGVGMHRNTLSRHLKQLGISRPYSPKKTREVNHVSAFGN